METDYLGIIKILKKHHELNEIGQKDMLPFGYSLCHNFSVSTEGVPMSTTYNCENTYYSIYGKKYHVSVTAMTFFVQI